jgi:hypothetical protein
MVKRRAEPSRPEVDQLSAVQPVRQRRHPDASRRRPDAVRRHQAGVAARAHAKPFREDRQQRGERPCEQGGRAHQQHDSQDRPVLPDESESVPNARPLLTWLELRQADHQE